MRLLNRILRLSYEAYLYLALAVLLGEFLFTFIIMFVLPPLAIAMVFVGLVTIIVLVGGYRVLDFFTLAMSRRMLGHETCPACHAEMLSQRDGDGYRVCGSCAMAFDARGRTIPPQVEDNPLVRRVA